MTKLSRRLALLSVGSGMTLAMRNAVGRTRPDLRPEASSAVCGNASPVTTGLEVLKAENWNRLQGRRVGLVANPTSVDVSLRHLADVLYEVSSVSLVAIFGPEHGFRGTAQAGSSEPRTVDARTGVSVFDIYAVSGAKLDTILKAASIDLLVFDIQDVGARFYTYVWTLYDVMASCARLGIPVMVLDRPNPITGLSPSGPVLRQHWSSFVGRASISIRHGMTVGELAQYFNRYCFGTAPAQLTVVAMKGWRRNLFFDQTGLPWVAPSPNMPSLETAIAYPGMCLFEGTNYSVGRGTAQPFLQMGSMDIDGGLWADALRRVGLPGVLFRETWFTPSQSVYQGRKVHGVNIIITDRTVFDPIATAIEMLSAAHALHSGDFWRDDGRPFDSLAGSSNLRSLLDQGITPKDILASWQNDFDAFCKRRAEVLLYG